ncbi:DUF3147 family protein [Candidatus Micrarchaeota archaeon]|nr:DUF3147 family protein [Candidatus Micrarchaeota archaeon]
MGGTAVSLAIFMAEKFGPKLGAVILSLPTTSLVALFFIGLSNSPDFVTGVTPFSIVGMSIYLVFLSFFILAAERLGKIALALVIPFWFALAFTVLKLPAPDLVLATVSFLTIYAIANFFLNGKKYDSKIEKPVTGIQIFLVRSLFGGLVISTAVFLSKISGPELGGLFTMFPATTISSYGIFANSYKKEFVLSVATKMLPFSLVIVFYALAVNFFYPPLGIYLGTIVSFALAFGFSYLLNRLIR